MASLSQGPGHIWTTLYMYMYMYIYIYIYIYVCVCVCVCVTSISAEIRKWITKIWGNLIALYTPKFKSHWLIAYSVFLDRLVSPRSAYYNRTARQSICTYGTVLYLLRHITQLIFTYSNDSINPHEGLRGCLQKSRSSIAQYLSKQILFRVRSRLKTNIYILSNTLSSWFFNITR